MNTLIKYVQEMHGNQLYGDMPYIVHLYAVARHFSDEKRKAVAFLHDIVEDTSVTVDDIRKDFGDEIADAVDALTRRDGEVYLSDYITRVAANSLALDVKIADLVENIYAANMSNSSKTLVKYRYEVALEYLLMKRILLTGKV